MAKEAPSPQRSPDRADDQCDTDGRANTQDSEEEAPAHEEHNADNEGGECDASELDTGADYQGLRAPTEHRELVQKQERKDDAHRPLTRREGDDAKHHPKSGSKSSVVTARRRPK